MAYKTEFMKFFCFLQNGYSMFTIRAIKSPIFESNLQNMFKLKNFNSPYQELNCTYITGNGRKLLDIIDDGNLKLWNNGRPNYQSNHYESKNMLNLRLCNLSVFKYFDNFQVSGKTGSNHSATFITLNLKLQTESH